MAGIPRNQQRLVVWEDHKGAIHPYATCYGDERYAQDMIAQCRLRHSIDIKGTPYVLDGQLAYYQRRVGR